MTERFSRLLATGSYLPARIVTNDELPAHLNTSDAWIVERTGIRQRHVAAEHETAATLAIAAAKQALERAELKPNQLDLIIVATCTPDRVFPSTACLVQAGLGVTNHCPAFDITAACAGFNYALSTADQFIRAGGVKRALVIGTELMTRMMNWHDRRTCILFGDGAGAAVLEVGTEPGIVSTHLHAAGQQQGILYYPNPLPERARHGLDLRADLSASCGAEALLNEAETMSAGDSVQSAADASEFMVMHGNEVFKHAVTALSDVIEETLQANQLSASAIDWFIPHQANQRIIAAVVKRLGMSMARVVMTVGEHANTSSASIPLALDTAISDGRIKRGEQLLLESFGAGVVWGSALIRY